LVQIAQGLFTNALYALKSAFSLFFISQSVFAIADVQRRIGKEPSRAIDQNSPMTFPSLRCPRFRQTRRSMFSLIERVEPSASSDCTIPVCQLRDVTAAKVGPMQDLSSRQDV
jgi:hypothetical protein